MGGGPSKQQTDAAAAQANLANTEAATSAQNNKTLNAAIASNTTRQNDIYNKVSPFASDLITKGLPFMDAMTDYNNGTTAAAALPARAALLRSIGGNSAAQPNGFKTAAVADFNDNLAKDFDSNMTSALMANQNAKLQGANVLSGQQANLNSSLNTNSSALNPRGWASGASAGNNSIMQAPLATPSPFAPLLGAVGSLGGAAIQGWGKPAPSTAPNFNDPAIQF
jgi:hypothetical protein